MGAASANDSLLVGTVSRVRPARRVLKAGEDPVFDGVLCDVTVANRRPNSALKGQPERYVIPRVRCAVPVQKGHEVFVSITDGDPRRGAWVVGHTSIPTAQSTTVNPILSNPSVGRAIKSLYGSTNGLCVHNTRCWFRCNSRSFEWCSGWQL